VGPFTEELKASIGEHLPGCVLTRRGRGVDFHRFTFGFDFAAQTAGKFGAKHDVADMLIADAQDFADFGAFVFGVR
jgi:hypothetical protein